MRIILNSDDILYFCPIGFDSRIKLIAYINVNRQRFKIIREKRNLC